MLRVLESEKAAGNQSESGWKSQVWTEVGAALAREGTNNDPPKTAGKCEDHFANVRTTA